MENVIALPDAPFGLNIRPPGLAMPGGKVFERRISPTL